MVSLLGKNLKQLQEVAMESGLPRFAGKQLADWLYVKRVSNLDEMSNISLKGREALKQQYSVGRHAPVKEAVSIDGTRKYLFDLSALGHQMIEAVYIPEEDRATLCVSTQAGCKMGCKFCMTGTLGFHGHLPAGEIVNQVFEINQRVVGLGLPAISNLVYMGEGEPMDNIDEVLRSLEVMTGAWGCGWSPHRITVSSVGYLKGLQRFLDESECHMAISLHNPYPMERKQIMPIEHSNPIEKVIALLKQYDWTHQRRLSFEYICFGGQNDTPKHAKELVRLLRGLNCRINLIRFHAGVEQAFAPSDEQQMVWLRDYLSEHGITTTIRRSRGEDILAACGLLVNSLSSHPCADTQR